MKVYVITGELGSYNTYRLWVHRVHISPSESVAKARAEEECAHLNAESAEKRLVMAREERARTHNVTQKDDPRSEDQLVHQFHSHAPHYEIEECEAVVTSF